MEIKVENYLSNEEIKEIVQDELRNQVKQLFKNETEAQRLLSNLSYQIVFNEVDKVVANSQDIIVKKTTDLVNDVKSYTIFRYSYLSGSPENNGARILEQAIIDNKKLINEKVKETIINKDYSEKIWDTFENLAETFMSNIYEITRLGREKPNKP
jgi:hypothetical protein